MAESFFKRLNKYYAEVASVLRGEASASSVFPNTSDKGLNREAIYAEFLRQHVPSKCNVFLGGFLFGKDGQESKQLDVIVTTDTTPRFDINNKDGKGKSFSPVDGTLAVAAIKSMLNRHELEETLLSFSRIPLTSDIASFSPSIRVPNLDDWPYKIIYSCDGIDGANIFMHLIEYYGRNPDIPIHRRPNVIHVAGKYVIFRAAKGHTIYNQITLTNENAKEGEFRLFTTESDVQAIVWTLDEIQTRATASTHAIFKYHEIFNRTLGIPPLNLESGQPK